MHAYDRVWRLSRAEWWALLEAWTGLLAAGLALRLLPFWRVERIFAPRRAGGQAGGQGGWDPGEPDPALVSRLVWASRAAARRHFRPMHCLPRALCLRWLLGRHGIETELRIGVSKRRGDLAAHAWVEHRGRPVGEVGDVADRFAILGAAAR
jgi:hypothetical protein